MEVNKMDRLEEIRKKVDLWFQFKLCADVDDIMPDVVYLLTELDKYIKKEDIG